MHDIDKHPAVIVVGGGPVGLTTALQLGRLGIPTQLVKERSGPTRHPKATGIHGKTMELLRQWGIAEDLRAASELAELKPSFTWVTRVTGEEIGVIDLTQDVERLTEAANQSPEFFRWCAQDVLEPVLLRAVQQQASVHVRYSTRMTQFSQDDKGVEVVVTEGSDSADPETIRADFLVAADGAHSAIRTDLGVGCPSTPIFGHHINVLFHADLTTWFGGREHMMWWIVNPETTGTLVALDRDRWIYQIGYDPDQQRPEDFTPEMCADTIRRAIDKAVPEIPITIDSILPWHLDTALADRFSDGRVFLVGDAAHRFPPTGGFGMNSGIGDSHNLAWKLAAVTRGWAGRDLLNSYEAERRPVAQFNLRQSMINTERSAEVGWVLADPETIAGIEGPGGAEVRAAMSAAIPNQRESYWSQGQQFGYVYCSSAVVPDGTEPVHSTISDYRMNAGPGAHAPHVWLHAPGEAMVSTIDLLHTRFVVLAGQGGQKWVTAAAAIASEFGVDVVGYRIGPGGDYDDAEGEFLARYALTDSGAVLVRPDGHVAFRARSQVADPSAALRHALARVLGLRKPVRAVRG